MKAKFKIAGAYGRLADRIGDVWVKDACRLKRVWSTVDCPAVEPTKVMIEDQGAAYERWVAKYWKEEA